MTRPQIDVVIVGAGFAGLYLLHRCRQLGLSARVWEKGNGVGGTWYWNRYPGARCDIESVQYSFQFDKNLQQQWNWSERYAAQPEILRYAEHVADRYKLFDGIDFNRKVISASYDINSCMWRISSNCGSTLNARFCVLATGCLSAPNWPKIEGCDSFGGEVHHTATWPHTGVDFSNKKVAVIGTGSSGVQSIPVIAEQAEQVFVFQRTPNYSIPAHNRPLDAETIATVKRNYDHIRSEAKKNPTGAYGEYRTLSALSVSESEREVEFEKRWQHGGLTFFGAFGDLLLNKEANDVAAAFVHNKINKIVDDPETAAKLCPQNIIGGKRLCVDTNYYRTYNRDNVGLIDLKQHPLVCINANGIVAGDMQYDVDIIVMATGFDAMTGAIQRIDITGNNGQSLMELWSNGPSSYLGVAMADFPNLFTVNGPGSPSVLTNMFPSIEHHVELITDMIKKSQDESCCEISVNSESEKRWWSHVQEMGRRGLKQSVDSWYVGANVEGKARIFMPYNGGLPQYLEKCEAMVNNNYEGFSFTSAGLQNPSN